MNKKIPEPIASAEIDPCASTNFGAAQAPRPRLRSNELFGTAREIVIEHAGDEYRLRLTHQDKLILTK